MLTTSGPEGFTRFWKAATNKQNLLKGDEGCWEDAERVHEECEWSCVRDQCQEEMGKRRRRKQKAQKRLDGNHSGTESCGCWAGDCEAARCCSVRKRLEAAGAGRQPSLSCVFVQSAADSSPIWSKQICKDPNVLQWKKRSRMQIFSASGVSCLFSCRGNEDWRNLSWQPRPGGETQTLVPASTVDASFASSHRKLPSLLTFYFKCTVVFYHCSWAETQEEVLSGFWVAFPQWGTNKKQIWGRNCSHRCLFRQKYCDTWFCRQSEHLGNAFEKISE